MTTDQFQQIALEVPAAMERSLDAAAKNVGSKKKKTPNSDKSREGVQHRTYDAQ
jgi:hypothetical protein